VAASTELQAQLKLQSEAAQALKKQRYQDGALNLETSEVTPVILNQQIVDVTKQEKNPATDLIEDFMIAANGVVARMLEKVSSFAAHCENSRALGPNCATCCRTWRKPASRPGFQGSQRFSD
jgi:exoribonuclease R